MKVANYSWWIGAIISPILTVALTGGSNDDDIGMLILVGVVNGVFWGWLIGFLIDKARGNPKETKPTPTTKKTYQTPPITKEVEINKSNSETDRNEFAEILYEFSMNQKALGSLEKIKSADTTLYFNEFLKLLKEFVSSKTGVNLIIEDYTCIFKSLTTSLKPITVELDKNRGKLLFISNNLGDVFKNHEGSVICSNNFIILGIEEDSLSRWLFMHLSGRIHEPKLFILTDNDILDCGTLPDASFQTVFNELDRRLERTPSNADWDNLMDEFYNKI
ncbi:hypothetical protein [Gillisia hiemivivida]|uniref:Uncharacterized protein n=1 Tax=Gillisia hiemivivida TaxID=291190 RepID=A0A5C6ZZP7_9FLAO|nr:hypothetical protein [Gillisia hiemivivida]TXD95666.1 hypothetical protein ES724_01140 [Gillisia hiemivivida]